MRSFLAALLFISAASPASAVDLSSVQDLFLKQGLSRCIDPMLQGKRPSTNGLSGPKYNEELRSAQFDSSHGLTLEYKTLPSGERSCVLSQDSQTKWYEIPSDFSRHDLEDAMFTSASEWIDHNIQSKRFSLRTNCAPGEFEEFIGIMSMAMVREEFFLAVIFGIVRGHSVFLIAAETTQEPKTICKRASLQKRKFSTTQRARLDTTRMAA